MIEQTKVNKIIKYSLTQLVFLISSFILVMDTSCCVNFEAGVVFGIFILAKLGIMLLQRNLWLKHILALQLYIFFFKFSYWRMNARLALLFIIFRLC